MKLSNLKKIVTEVNNKSLLELPWEDREQKHDAMSADSETLPTACMSGSIKCRKQTFSGRTNKDFTCDDDFLNKSLLLPKKLKAVAVGSIIDSQRPVSDESDSRIILAIGINYVQGVKYGNPANHPLLLDNTKMRRRLQAVFNHLSANSDGCESWASLEEDKFHLVVANFFPWITKYTWSNFNSIEEMLLIKCYGFINPYDHIEKLVLKMGSHLEAVVFHGANNCVPYLGGNLPKSLDAALTESQVKVVFCDNLAPSPKPDNVSNGVRLCCNINKSNLEDRDCDE